MIRANNNTELSKLKDTLNNQMQDNFNKVKQQARNKTEETIVVTGYESIVCDNGYLQILSQKQQDELFLKKHLFILNEDMGTIEDVINLHRQVEHQKEVLNKIGAMVDNCTEERYGADYFIIQTYFEDILKTINELEKWLKEAKEKLNE